jgi:hypothetical protein
MIFVQGSRVRIIPIFVSVGLSVAPAQLVQPLVVTGAPYSADRVQQHVGSTKTYVIGHSFRDSDGRTRAENERITGGWTVEIFDPVAGVVYVLDDAKKVAYRSRAPSTAPNLSAPTKETFENLGTRIIGGVLAEGTRRSSGPLIIETWDSVELKVNLLTKSSNGYTSKLVNVRRIDPDPALFWPPGDYTIVDQ